jgi:uncharacterized protein
MRVWATPLWLDSCVYSADLVLHPRARTGSSPERIGNYDGSMPIASMTIELRIEHAHSLKDRRQVVRSLKEKLAHGFNVSVAELDEAVTWQSATIGVAAISASRDYLSGQMQQLEQAASRIVNDLGAQITDVWWQFVEEG